MASCKMKEQDARAKADPSISVFDMESAVNQFLLEQRVEQKYINIIILSLN